MVIGGGVYFSRYRPKSLTKLRILIVFKFCVNLFQYLMSFTMVYWNYKFNNFVVNQKQI